MSWKTGISTDTAVWRAVVEYANERIGYLTGVCTSTVSTVEEIRQAQAGIEELHRLVDLPQVVRAEAQIRAQSGARKEY